LKSYSLRYSSEYSYRHHRFWLQTQKLRLVRQDFFTFICLEKQSRFVDRCFQGFVNFFLYWRQHSASISGFKFVTTKFENRKSESGWPRTGVGNLRPAWTVDMARIRIFVTEVRVHHVV